MKSRMSSWASFFTLGGMSPSTCGDGAAAQGLVLKSSFPWPVSVAQGPAPTHTSLRLGFFMGKRGPWHHHPGSSRERDEPAHLKFLG